MQPSAAAAAAAATMSSRVWGYVEQLLQCLQSGVAAAVEAVAIVTR